MVAVNVSYSFAPGATLYGGRLAPAAPSNGGFSNVTVVSEDAGVPRTTANQTLYLALHGSAGQNTTTGRQFSAEVSGLLAYEDQTIFRFSTARATDVTVTVLRPVDDYDSSSARLESHWLGFSDAPDADVRLITVKRLEALVEWAKSNVPNINWAKTCLGGGSMGAWGTISFGLRRPHLFAAIYPDRPRWRYGYDIGTISVPSWTGSAASIPYAEAPNVRADFGGGSVFDILNGIAYVANTANRAPWVGWCVGRQDGFTEFPDHVDAVAALRTAKRGFAFAWNDGNHTTGSIMSEIIASYPYGTFELNKGYPLFTEHSGDQDPAVDLVGGINIGLSFRNVLETAGGWSCEVTSILGARTVKVEPISDIFTATVAPQLVTIPAANTWVPVSFTA